MRPYLSAFATALVLLMAGLQPVAAQNEGSVEFTGTVRSDAGDPLPGAGVFIEGTFIGGPTNGAGTFRLRVPARLLPAAVRVSFVGYETVVDTLDRAGTPLNVMLQPSLTLINEVVVSASRRRELSLRAGATVDKLNVEQLGRLATPDMLTGLARQKGVDVTSNAIFMASLSTRGFQGSTSERLVQLVDYMDTQTPSLNINAGNSLGLPEVDIASVEILHGPSSALYGANAFNGVVLTNSKDPYEYQGLSVRLRGGNRDYADAQLRYALRLGKRWALKVSGSYARANDWIAENYEAANSAFGQGNNAADSGLGYDAVNRYGDVGTTFGASGGALAGKTVFMPGWTERDIIASDDVARLYRVLPSVHFLVTDKIKASLEYKHAQGVTSYQFTNRYRFKNFVTDQYRAELKGDNWYARAYQTLDDAHDTYDLLFTGAYMQNSVDPRSGPAGLTYAQEYFGTFARAYNTSLAQHAGDVAGAEAAARAAAAPYQLTPGSADFNEVRQRVITDPTPGKGSRVNPTSLIRDFSGQYNRHLAALNLDLVAGGAYRQFRLGSNGLLFADLPGGERIRNEEYGVYLQLSKLFLNDRLKVTAAGRADGFQNFKGVYSPRLSAVYSVGEKKQHNFRTSYNQAFRSPTQQGQYLNLDLRRVLLLGNVDKGFQGYGQGLDQTRLQVILAAPSSAPEALQAYEVNLGRLKPERVTTTEIGYKGALTNSLTVDVNFYRSQFHDFIGQVRFIGNTDGSRPTVAQLAEAGTPPRSYQDPNQPTRVLQVQANAAQEVRASGGLVAFTYTPTKAWGFTGNYALNILETRNLPENFQSYYNTPKNKFNFGFFGAVKGFSYSLNHRWAQGHLFETPFATGQLAAISSLDGTLSYALPKLHVTTQLGGTNLLNTNNIQIYGGPQIGRLAYVGLTVDVQ